MIAAALTQGCKQAPPAGPVSSMDGPPDAALEADCASGQRSACTSLALRQRDALWYACAGGADKACDQLGQQERANGRQDPAKVRGALRVACDRGGLQACDEAASIPQISCASMELRLQVGPQGISLVGAEGLLPAAPLPCASGTCRSAGDYDWTGLYEQLSQIKDACPDAHRAVLEPAPGLSSTTIAVAVATLQGPGPEGPLFRSVVLAGRLR
jgi:hypothetical protein